MDKGVVQIICGNGQGKSSLALGKSIEAMTNNQRVIMIQFLKGMLTTQTAEWLKRLEPDMKVFRFERQSAYFENLEEGQKKEEALNIQNGINFARKVLSTGECDMLILDEFLGIMDQELVTMEEFSNLLSAREEGVSLLLTGKVCPPQMEQYADIITRIENVDIDK